MDNSWIWLFSLYSNGVGIMKKNKKIESKNKALESSIKDKEKELKSLDKEYDYNSKMLGKLYKDIEFTQQLNKLYRNIFCI